MRGKWEIILDVLLCLERDGDSKKTRIMQRSYLDWRSFKKYFNFLIDNGYIEELNDPPENGDELYGITENGRELLNELKDVKEILKTDEGSL